MSNYGPLASLLPKHKITLILTHNPHRSMYQSVEEYALHNLDQDEWANEGERAKAIELDDFWELQWYPNTPIGSITLAAHDLNILLREAQMP